MWRTEGEHPESCSSAIASVFCAEAVLLGSAYGVSAAFAVALICSLLGIGSQMAFSGSMFCALVCGVVYAKTKTSLEPCQTKYSALQFPVVCALIRLQFFMGQSAAGAVISAVLIYSLKKSNILHTMQESLNR